MQKEDRPEDEFEEMVPHLPTGSGEPRRGTELEKLVTVIVTTSPIPDHPSTAMLEHTVTSFRHVEGLASCRIIIVCDGVRSSEQDALKRGLVTSETEVNYRGYIASLRHLILEHRSTNGPFHTAEVLELDSHQGFGWALWAGLRIVDTRYVLVAQHDYCFERSVDLFSVTQAMADSSGGVSYVLMPSQSTRGYIHKISSQYRIKLEAEMQDFGSTQLCPLLFWYDKTHIAEREHYIKTVFDSGRVGQGQFIEDTLGQEMLAECKTSHDWRAAHRPYATYLLMDDDSPAIRHSHGRRWRHDRDVQRDKESGGRDLEAEKRLRQEERRDHNKARRKRKQQARRAMLEAFTPEERAAFLANEKGAGKPHDHGNGHTGRRCGHTHDDVD